MMPNAKQTGPFSVGDRILDKYEVKGLLGKGGHAYVYHCFNAFLAEEVAIKLIPNPPMRGQQLFNRARGEAQVLYRLNHPNVVRVMDGGEIDGMAYIVMEKLEGLTLREMLRSLGRLTVIETLTIALQVAEALEAAHAMNVIHRDLKPDNIFLLAENQVKVLDFGIAKFLEGGYQTTQKDLIQGTAPYMSPEQAQGHGVTFASDIFQLGTIMYEMIAGICPCMIGVEDPTPQVLVAIQISKLPPRLKSLVPEIPDYVDRLIWRAIAKQAQQRFSVMREFADGIRGALGRLLDELPRDQRSIRTLRAPERGNRPSASDSRLIAAPRTTPIALVARKPGRAEAVSNPDSDRISQATGGSERGEEQRMRSTPPVPDIRNARTLTARPLQTRRTPNGSAIAAAMANRVKPDFRSQRPSADQTPASTARGPRDARRMLVGAVLVGTALALPLGVGLGLFRRTHSVAAPEASGALAARPVPNITAIPNSEPTPPIAPRAAAAASQGASSRLPVAPLSSSLVQAKVSPRASASQAFSASGLDTAARARLPHSSVARPLQPKPAESVPAERLGPKPIF